MAVYKLLAYGQLLDELWCELKLTSVKLPAEGVRALCQSCCGLTEGNSFFLSACLTSVIRHWKTNSLKLIFTAASTQLCLDRGDWFRQEGPCGEIFTDPCSKVSVSASHIVHVIALLWISFLLYYLICLIAPTCYTNKLYNGIPQHLPPRLNFIHVLKCIHVISLVQDSPKIL